VKIKVDLKFAITDTGIGIAEDKLEYILKTFNKQQIRLQEYLEAQD
jgi:signal transduction histidine kinase